MRLDGGPSLYGARDPGDILAPHFQKFYPLLVEFLEAFSSTLNDQVLTPQQVQALINDESWWSRRNDVFLTPSDRLFQKITDLREFCLFKGMNQLTNKLIERKSLHRSTNTLETIDDLNLFSSDDRELSAQELNEHVSMWLRDMGLELLGSNHFDEILFIKLSKHLFKIRGSMECAKIFFESMYGGSVDIFLPRTQISALDDNMVLDGTTKLRDDSYYDEFTYVVNLIGSDYTNIGDKYFKLWKERFHPGGFKCVFNVYTEDEWLIVKDALSLPEKIGVWKQFFEGKFSEIFTNLFPV